jgi:hypothetical protein
MMKFAALGALCVAAAACSVSEDPLPAPCATGIRNPDGTCVTTTPVGCQVGDVKRADGSCQKPGIPADGCANGFKHDGDRGCAAVLPAMPCGAGTFAVPGESACHEPAACGVNAFPAAPNGGKAHYVDAAYVGGANDGTIAHPFTTVQAAVDAAAAGDAVLVAAGNYAEDVALAKAVRVIGVCPAKVLLSGAKGVAIGASKAELHALAVMGGAVTVTKASEVVLEGVWLHDATAEALIVDDGAATLRKSLIDHPVGYGIRTRAAELTVDASVVRDVGAGKFLSGAIYALQNFTTKKGSRLVVRGSLIERTPYAAIYATGSEVNVEASVLRDVTAGSNDAGAGISLSADDGVAKLTMTGSLIERVVSEGLFLGHVEAHIDTTVIRTGKPTPMTTLPSGINAGTEIGAGQVALTIERSLIEDFPEEGVVVFGGTATLKSVLIRDIRAGSDELAIGVYVSSSLEDESPATVTLSDSAIERAASNGLWVSASNATVNNCAVRDLGAAAPVIGTGILAYTSKGKKRTSLNVTHSLVDGARMVAIWSLGSDAVIEDTTVQKTRPSTTGVATGLAADASPEPATLVARRTIVDGSAGTGVAVFHKSTVTLEECRISNTAAVMGIDGDGVSVLSKDATLTVTKTRIDHSARAGIAAFGAKVTIAGSTLTCQAFDFDSEPEDGVKASFSDGGGNTCGCPEATGGCHAATAMLQPPPPLPAPMGP